MLTCEYKSRAYVHLRHTLFFLGNQVHGVPHPLRDSAGYLQPTQSGECGHGSVHARCPGCANRRVHPDAWFIVALPESQGLKASSTSQWTACLILFSDLGVSHMAWLRNEALKLMDDLEPAAWTVDMRGLGKMFRNF